MAAAGNPGQVWASMWKQHQGRGTQWVLAPLADATRPLSARAPLLPPRGRDTKVAKSPLMTSKSNLPGAGHGPLPRSTPLLPL